MEESGIAVLKEKSQASFNHYSAPGDSEGTDVSQLVCRDILNLNAFRRI
jgi:hypothetical protein